MAGKCVPCIRSTIAFKNGFGNLVCIEHGAKRHVTAAESLGERGNVRQNIVVVLKCSPGTTAAGPTHNFIGDHQDTIAVADVANFSNIAAWRWNDPTRCTDDRLKNEGCNIFRALFENFLFQFIGKELCELVLATRNRRTIRVRR